MKTLENYKHYSIIDFLEFPDDVIFALVSKELNIVYISQSTVLVTGINNILKHMKRNRNVKDLLPKFEFIVLTTSLNKRDRELQVSFYMDDFKKAGWKVLNTKKPLRFKGVYIAKRENMYYVYLNSARSSKYVVAVFPSAEEAKEFYKKNYRNKEIRKMIYSTNKYTKAYLGKKYPKV